MSSSPIYRQYRRLPIIIDQDAHGGISELSVGLNVLGVDVMKGIAGVLASLSVSFVSIHTSK